MRICPKAALAALTLAALATPGVASAQNSVSPQVSAQVPVADLNLNNQKGQDALGKRVESVSRSLCGDSASMDLSTKQDEAKCRREIRKNGALAGERLALKQRQEAELAAARTHSARAYHKHPIHHAHRVVHHHRVVRHKVAHHGPAVTKPRS